MGRGQASTLVKPVAPMAPLGRIAPPAPMSPARFSRRRAISLALVHLAMAAHYVHWKLAGRTLAPLELNEAVYAAAEGVVTAGFLLLCLLTLSSLVVGRFFCSWGCHVLAVQDLSAWALGKLGIHPRPVRSRVLRALPFVVMAYMFLWPVVYRALHGLEVAAHTRAAGMAWSSFVTDDYTRNLPAWPVALLTFATCCFLIIYLMGSRSFCSTVCPYGAIFALADRAAPGRIVARGDCLDCTACTTACTSHIPVHLELARHGTVVDSACMRDLDCVAACPDGRVSFGFTTPPLLRKLDRSGALASRWDLSWREEALLLLVFAVTFFSLRGLFGALPFLLTLTLAVLLAFGTWMSLRVLRPRPLKWSSLQLRDGRGVTGAGRAWLGFNAAGLLFVLHCGAMRGLELRAATELERAEVGRATPAVAAEHARKARVDLMRLHRFAIDPPHDLVRRLARSAELAGDRKAALDFLRLAPEREDTGLEEARMLAESGRAEEALVRLSNLLARFPGSIAGHFQSAVLLAGLGRKAEACGAFEACLTLAPEHAVAHNNLGLLLEQQGRTVEAAEHLGRAAALAPDSAATRFNYGRLLVLQGRAMEARAELEAARRLDPRCGGAVAELLGVLR